MSSDQSRTAQGPAVTQVTTVTELRPPRRYTGTLVAPLEITLECAAALWRAYKLAPKAPSKEEGHLYVECKPAIEIPGLGLITSVRRDRVVADWLQAKCKYTGSGTDVPVGESEGITLSDFGQTRIVRITVHLRVMEVYTHED